jgi:hypothetical protein
MTPEPAPPTPEPAATPEPTVVPEPTATTRAGTILQSGQAWTSPGGVMTLVINKGDSPYSIGISLTYENHSDSRTDSRFPPA